MSLECGFSQAVITPVPYQTYMDGFGGRLSPAEGIRDELYVKVCAMKLDCKRIAIISFDVCGFSREVSVIIKTHIKYITGLAFEDIIICATHTHAGPSGGLLTVDGIRAEYWHIAGDKAASCVNKAFENCTAGSFNFAFSDELQSKHNRRGDELNDRRVKVGGFYDKDSNLRGIIVNAACHPVIRRDMLYSSDFISVLTANTDVPAIFLQGGCGDINPYAPNLSPDEHIAQLGGELVTAVLNGIEKLKFENKNDVLINLSGISEIPMKFPSKDDVIKTLDILYKEYNELTEPIKKHFKLPEILWHEKALQDGEAPTMNVPLNILVINDIIIITLPFEPLTRTALTIEDMAVAKGFKRENIIVVGYANEVNGYLAPSADISRGGYEMGGAAIWYVLPQCTPESEKAFLQTISDLLKKI
ncbi:MAG: hypothetical protein FWF15_08690 [Oscillospiraceae bacterium]|nr:hypothetical protein [Oscillospiraceae bacterium]